MTEQSQSDYSGFAILKGLRLTIRWKYIYLLFFLKIYTCIMYIIFKNKINFENNRNSLLLRHDNGVYLCSCTNLKVLLKISGFLLLYSAFLSQEIFLGTCSSVEMLKGYTCSEKCCEPWSKIWKDILNTWM